MKTTLQWSLRVLRKCLVSFHKDDAGNSSEEKQLLDEGVKSLATPFFLCSASPYSMKSMREGEKNKKAIQKKCTCIAFVYSGAKDPALFMYMNTCIHEYMSVFISGRSTQDGAGVGIGH